MSRYDVEKFQPPPDPELICCICQCVLDNAKESPCRHVFCKVCIEQWLDDHNSCPTCRTWLSKRDLQNVLPLVQNMINKLIMHCDFRTNGCDQKLMLEMYDVHIKKCDFKLLQCPYSGCNATLLHKNLSEHVNHLCEFREVTCNKGCHLKVPINELSTHDCLASLKLKSEKQQKLIEEYLKTIKKFISLKDMLKKKVENLLQNFERTSPLHGEHMSGLLSSSYEEDEDITPINVIPRTTINSDARLSVMSNYFEFYVNAVDQITDEVNRLQSETVCLLNSESNSGTTNHIIPVDQIENQSDSLRENRQRRRREDVTAEVSVLGNSVSALRSVDDERFSQLTDAYQSVNSDQEHNIHTDSVPSSYTAENGAATGTDDYPVTDRELEDSYVADSEEGNDSFGGFNYDNASDNEIFESDDDIASDVSSSIQSSLIANIHSESVAADDAVRSSSHGNLYNQATDLWVESNNVQLSSENNNLHMSETVTESDNVSANATDGDSYVHQSEDNYLSSNYLSSPSVTSVQYSPLLSSSPLHESDSDMYDHNVVLFSDYSDDEMNHDIELMSDSEVMFALPLETQCNNPQSEDNQTPNDNNDRSSTLFQLAISNSWNSADKKNNEDSEAQHSVCVVEPPSDISNPHRMSTTNNSNSEINEVSITHIYSSDNKLSVTNDTSTDRVPSHMSVYQQRHRCYEIIPEPVTMTSQHHVLQLLQSGKESMRFTQHVVSGNPEPSCPPPPPGLSIKIEPTLDFIRVSSSESGSVQKSTLTTRTVCVPLHEMSSRGSEVISERVIQTDIPTQYPSSQCTLPGLHFNQRLKRPNSSSAETNSIAKHRRVRDRGKPCSQSGDTAALRTRVDLSLKNVCESSTEPLTKHLFYSHYPATLTTPTASTTSIMTPSITTSRPILNSTNRLAESANSITKREQKRSTYEWQMNIQSDRSDIHFEERSLSSVSATESEGGFHPTTRLEQLHSHKSEYYLDQTDSDNASYEPSESSDSDVPESDSSYEVLIPKTISQLLEEYNSEETDESWTFDMD